MVTFGDFHFDRLSPLDSKLNPYTQDQILQSQILKTQIIKGQRVNPNDPAMQGEKGLKVRTIGKYDLVFKREGGESECSISSKKQALCSVLVMSHLWPVFKLDKQDICRN